MVSDHKDGNRTGSSSLLAAFQSSGQEVVTARRRRRPNRTEQAALCKGKEGVSPMPPPISQGQRRALPRRQIRKSGQGHACAHLDWPSFIARHQSDCHRHGSFWPCAGRGNRRQSSPLGGHGRRRQGSDAERCLGRDRKRRPGGRLLQSGQKHHSAQHKQPRRCQQHRLSPRVTRGANFFTRGWPGILFRAGRRCGSGSFCNQRWVLERNGRH